MNGEWIRFDEAARWDAALDEVGGADVYFRRAYLGLLRDRGEGEPALFMARGPEGSACHVALIRQLPERLRQGAGVGGVDLTSPYGYAGPVLGRTSAALADGFLEAWGDAARSLGAVSEFVRFHPVLRTHEPFSSRLDAPLVAETVAMDLTAGAPVDRLTSTCRKNYGVAVKKGVQVEFRGASDIGRFANLYRATMQRLGAAGYYLFDDDYFERMASDLGDDLVVALATHSGRDAAGALVLRCGKYLHYHLGGSDFSLRSLCATNLLLVRIAEWGRERGCEVLHLGGGVRSADSLFQFKAGFSPVRCKFHIGRIVYDESAYQRLVAIREREGAMNGGYFPLYRSPIPNDAEVKSE